MSRLPKSHRHPTPRTLHFLLTTKNLINFYAIFTIIFPFSRFTLSLVPPCSINNKKCFFIPENSYSIMSFCHVRSCEERREANMCECHWAGSMIWLGVMFRGYAWHFSRCSMFFFFGTMLGCMRRLRSKSFRNIYETRRSENGWAIYGDCIQVQVPLFNENTLFMTTPLSLSSHYITIINVSVREHRVLINWFSCIIHFN